ncbi:hypothetical protein HDU76_000526 [Blyttiomyces sp. JEL0837]|nr:hypothetical protein HDU76_000526 [Blyttiomyces sp. JEL0837]
MTNPPNPSTSLAVDMVESTTAERNDSRTTLHENEIPATDTKKPDNIDDAVIIDEKYDDDGVVVDDIYDIIDAVVPRTDDPTLPTLTLRVWIIGVTFALLFAFINTLFTFRTNPFMLNPFIGTLLAYPLGIFLSYILPKNLRIGSFSINEGHFNFKEHALVLIFCSTAAGPAYALYNIVGQKYQLYQTDLTSLACVGFAIVTQCFGYGLAGLCRRYLVRPAAMLWPTNLATIAMLNALHESDTTPAASSRNEGGGYWLSMSRYKFFWIVTAAMTLYQFIPTFVAPILTAVSILCYVAPFTRNQKLTRGLGSAQPGGGLGFLSLTFDWSIIGGQAPITTPLWALLNQYLGIYLFLYIIVPILWVNNAFGIDYSLGTDPRDGPNASGQFPLGFALNTPALFDNTGKAVSARSFVNRTTLSLNEKVYNEKKPIYITTYFAIEYATSFLVFTAAIGHVVLWYGRDVWIRFRTAMKDLDKHDVHAAMMDVYDDVPDWWYLLLLGVNLVLGIIVCQFGGFGLPWWGVILALVLAAVTILPIGTIQAISGQQIGLNVMSEFLIGLILPGRIAAVMAFKTLSYMAMSQGLSLVGDLKLGHYLKIPPRDMFVVQLVATLLATVVNVFTAGIDARCFESLNHGGFKLAADYNRLDVLKYLIESVEVEPAVDDNFAIKVASQNGHAEMVRYLLSLGGRVDATVDDNFAVREAKENGHPKVDDLILLIPGVSL